MAKMIHYQDDLFSLSVLVKSLDFMLATEADPEYFSERVDSDLGFIGKNLQSFGALLEENTLLIERAECLKLLERNVKAFVGILDRIKGSGYPHSEAYAAGNARVGDLANEQKVLLARLDDLVRTTRGSETENDIVSQDELSELLKI
jgi:hypothetical protein